MATTPPSPTSPPTLPPALPLSGSAPATSAIDLQAALTFARTLAQEELYAIDRMHQRTVRYILAVVSVLFLAGGVIGWLGFNNLRDSATAVARKQVQSETITQVRDQLTRDNLNGVVAAQVDGFTRNQLTSEVNRAINVGPLHDEILHNAREQSQSQLNVALAPRKLNDQQARQLANNLRDFRGEMVFITSLTYDVESQNYESQLTEAVKAGGLVLGQGNYLATPDKFSYGVTIVYDQVWFDRFHPDYPKHLLAVFQNAGIRTVLFPGKEIHPESESTTPVITIWVGPREILPTPK